MVWVLLTPVKRSTKETCTLSRASRSADTHRQSPITEHAEQPKRRRRVKAKLNLCGRVRVTTASFLRRTGRSHGSIATTRELCFPRCDQDQVEFGAGQEIRRGAQYRCSFLSFRLVSRVHACINQLCQLRGSISLQKM